ncbi:hypothetical protein JCM10908_004418 [Rhodotorula pacifica]|uniref:cytochrome b5-like heme/steroid binding domain-containing protein n=1 Tax=Rhodotorula pacifica TaxID=1495444 RepID=UPI0031797CEF
MLSGLTNGIGRVLGYSTPSIVAEPDTTSVAFPAINSQQRSGAKAAPTLSLSPPGADSDQSGGELPDQDEEQEGEAEGDEFSLPAVRINGSGASSLENRPSSSSSSSRSAPPTPSTGGGGASLLPPTSTSKVVKAPKGRVRVEKGFSQLDWAKLNRSGEVDLTGGVDSLLRVTPSELAKHNTREDCWQVYAGRVYNVGPFLRYHPGGVGEMMRGAGKDVLAHAWVNYETLLENCLVGFLVPE